MLKFLSSVKLTLTLLLLLAVLSIWGTIKPAETFRYELYYQSFWYRTLLSLLALNLISCTVKIIPRQWRFQGHLFRSLESRSSGEPVAASFEKGTEQLRQAGFRVAVQQEQAIAVRRGLGRWGATVVHVAILLIMLGAVLGETGFVGTINTYLKQANAVYFDWDLQHEQELGFQFRADSFSLLYYPIQLRFDLVDAETLDPLGQLTLYDNENFQVPGQQLEGRLRGFDPDEELLQIDIYSGGQKLGEYLVGRELEKFGSRQHPSFRLRNVMFRDPVLKQMEAEVSILEAGQVVKQGVIRVNEPLTYRGVSIYQTAYGQDEFGNRSVGFQLSKDPGEGLVWVATILLVLGLLLAFCYRPQVVGIKDVNGQLQLIRLQGWKTEAARSEFEKICLTLGS